MASKSKGKARKKVLKSASKALERADLLECGSQVLEEAMTRINGKFTRNQERVAWGRVVASIIASCTSTLRDSDLEDIRDRLERLEGSK
jgi:hypothetical protein